MVLPYTKITQLQIQPSLPCQLVSKLCPGLTSLGTLDVCQTDRSIRSSPPYLQAGRDGPYLEMPPQHTTKDFWDSEQLDQVRCECYVKCIMVMLFGSGKCHMSQTTNFYCSFTFAELKLQPFISFKTSHALMLAGQKEYCKLKNNLTS